MYIEESEYLKCLNIVRTYLRQVNNEISGCELIKDFVTENNLSTRARNCLLAYCGEIDNYSHRCSKRFQVKYVKDINLKNMGKYVRGFGKKSWVEIENILIVKG